MTPESVFAKSHKGLEEIETRAHRLGSRLRQVLIRIDGVKTLDELVDEAGDMGEALMGQIDELAKLGFVIDTTAYETIETAQPEPVPAPAPAAANPAPAPAKAEPPPEAVEFNSPVKFRLQDLLVEAMGTETGKVGAALADCRDRDDLARWVDYAYGHIETAAGKEKAKAFYKSARKLVGG
jgi:hypothetical protein